MKVTYLALAATITLAACVPMPPAVSDISADRVKIVKRLGTSDAAAQEEARRACAMFNRIATDPLSFRRLPDGYSQEVLFVCRPVSPSCQNIAGNIICPDNE